MAGSAPARRTLIAVAEPEPVVELAAVSVEESSAPLERD
jgi:hypothetical protein